MFQVKWSDPKWSRKFEVFCGVLNMHLLLGNYCQILYHALIACENVLNILSVYVDD